MMNTTRRLSDSTTMLSRWLPAALIPFISGCALTVGYFLSTEYRIPFNEPRFLITLLVTCALSIFGFGLAFDLFKIPVRKELSSLQLKATHTRRNSVFSFLHKALTPELTLKTSSVLCDAIRMALCWSVWILLVYPGLRGYDSGDMMAQYLGLPALGQKAGVIWDHHPWFDTLLYGFFAKFGHDHLGAYVRGIYLLAVLQSVLAAFSFSLVFAWFRHSGLSRKWTLGVYWFVSLFPLYPLSTAAIAKDNTHAIFMVPWALMFLVLATDRLKKITSPWFFALFFLDGVLCALTIKIGLPIILVSLFLLLFVRSQFPRRLLVVLCIIATIVFAGILPPRLLFHRLHIIPGNASAAYVVPIGMLARVAHDHPDGATAREKKILSTYIDWPWEELGKRYSIDTTDNIVTTAGQGTRPGRPSQDVIRVWRDIGRRYPKEYALAFLQLESGWFSFAAEDTTSKPIYLQRVRLNVLVPAYQEDGDAFDNMNGGLELTSGISAARDGYLMLCNTPVFNLPCMVPLYTLILPLFTLYALWRIGKARRRHYHRAFHRLGYESFTALTPFLISAASVYICSVSQTSQHLSATRYVIPALFLVPIVVCFLRMQIEETDDSAISVKEAPSGEIRHKKEDQLNVIRHSVGQHILRTNNSEFSSMKNNQVHKSES